MVYRLGIDLGGTNIVVGVVDENFNIVAKTGVKTNPPCTNEGLFLTICNLCVAALEKAGLEFSDIYSIGIGSAGGISIKEGKIIASGNLKVENFEICRLLTEKFGVKTFIENDANAATYGEFIAGAGKNTKNFAVMTLGTGVGIGIIHDGKIVSGRSNGGGEMGHAIIDADGEPCQCGRKGCLEAYASATALIKQTKRAMEKTPESLMWQVAKNIDNVDGRTAFDAWRMGDAAATEVVKRYTSYIAIGYLNIDMIYDVEKLCIGGGISGEGDNLISLIKEYVDKQKLRYINAEICIAKLGNDAGIIGAAFLDKIHN